MEMHKAHRPILSLALSTLLLALPAGARAAGPVAVSSVRAPGCAPETLNASAVLDGAVTVSPMPGAADASPQTQISFLGVPVGALGAVSVIGSHSGAHTGRLEAYSQGDGGSFVPRTPFWAGERVTVSARLTLAGAAAVPLLFHFTVGATDSLTTTPPTPHRLAPNERRHLVSRPDLQPPIVGVHTQTAGQAPGDVFLAPYGVAGQAGPMIVDGAGKLIWFNPIRAPMAATNLRVQQLDGVPVLTWWQGTITVHGYGLGVDVVAGGNYQTIAEVKAGNGYRADLHDFQITPQRTALVTAYNAVYCNLASLGGSADGAVTDSLLQEIDIKTGLVMFEWTALDHVALSASYSSAAAASPRWPLDFFHLNSINLDADGSLLLSSRNTWAADDIDHRTGQVLWTLGGKQSTFTEHRGAATAFQHDARPLGPDSFTMFDNGASPQTHAQSRGVVLDVDPQTRSVSVHRQFLHPGRRLLADSQGDMQALPNGDWFVGWGQVPDFSEFSASGHLLFDASLPAGYESYRALRFPWTGTPRHAPTLVLSTAARGRAVAYASWNGATEVSRWQLLEGRSRSALTPFAVVARTDFETAIALSARPGERFAGVRALDAAGRVLASSGVVALPAASPAGARAARSRDQNSSRGECC